jgi:hypothetical protein
MQAYRILGSAELFSQYCQVPNLSNNVHLKALTKEITTSTGIAAQMHKGQQMIMGLQKALDNILTSPPNEEERVNNDTVEPPSTTEAYMPIPRISNAPAIMQMRDPMAKRN